MLGFLFWIFVLILALSYFGITVQDIVNSPAGQANIAYVWMILTQLYHMAVNFLTSLATKY